MRKPLFSKKRVAVLLLCCFVIVTPIVHAFLPAFAVAWLISGSNLLISDLVAAQLGVVAGWLWYDCNGFTSISTCKNSAQSSINPTSVDNVFGKVPLQVKLNPDATRMNPDPQSWSDASGGSRNPTPKTSFAAVGSKSYPPQSGLQMSTIIANSQNQPFDTYAQISGTATAYKKTYFSTPTNTRPDTSLTNGAPTWQTEGMYLYAGSNWYVWSKPVTTITLTCPTGYTMNNGTCNLTASPSAVQKPGSTKCEVLYSASTQTFDFDAQNPNCSGLSDTLVKNGKLSSPSTDSGQKISATPTSNGGFQICQTEPDGSWKCLNTGPYNPAAGGYPGETLTSGNGGTPGDTGPGTGPGTGTGTGTGTGNGTGSGGSCGGTGQVKCSIDDSGLEGKAMDVDAQVASVQTAHDSVLSAIQSHLPTAFVWNWTLPVQPVACSSISYRVLNMTFAVDWCKYVHYIQQAISFLAYCFTALHLFKIVTRPARRS